MLPRKALVFAWWFAVANVLSYTPPTPPKISPATNLPNKLYRWKNQQIRYQEAGPAHGEAVLLIHGLFVNSDHWRKTIAGLSSAGYRVYALDLLGYGYSSKPPFDSEEAQAVNGENGRFDDNGGILKDVELGTADGKGVRVRDVDLKHPIKSPYNFFTWSQLINDFVTQVVKKEGVTLVSNSIGTISVLQAIIDAPKSNTYAGACVVTPNFRELHSAEIAFPQLAMPVVRFIQSNLRERGQSLFDALATPKTVKEILKEPYKVTDAIDDTLVDVLLDPLLLEGGSKVVFDTLSYSAGPLPEQQLGDFPKNKPVWICYGRDDPWTPSTRVEAMINKDPVERVIGFDGVGHCPHDEAPEQVNEFLLEFLDHLGKKGKKDTPKSGIEALASVFQRSS